MITTPAAATFLFFTGAVTAGALDLKDLSPCRTAAARGDPRVPPSRGGPEVY
jgi:hypothetical protein